MIKVVILKPKLIFLTRTDYFHEAVNGHIIHLMRGYGLTVFNQTMYLALLHLNYWVFKIMFIRIMLNKLHPVLNILLN